MTIRDFEESMNDKRLFYRLPKKLFEDSAYGEMTTDAKMLYMLLLDRRCLSDMNGDEWRDDCGCVFIYFTVEEMMRLLHFGNKKVNELLRELEKYNLIQRKHRGLCRPNRIYVYDLLAPHNSNWKPGANLTTVGADE